MPRATVLIATYHGRFLSQTLESVLTQTFEDFEVLVLDDAASPECEALVDSFGDPRLKYRPNAKNLGPAMNHASGLRQAAGELTAILNHDDLWEPNTLALLVDAIDANPRAVAAFSRAKVATTGGGYDSGRTHQAWRVWDCHNVQSGVIENWFHADTKRLGFPIGPAALFVSAKAAKVRIPKVVGGAYDYWLGYRLARLGPVVHVLDAVGYWREHEDNLSSYRSAKQVLEQIYINGRAAGDRKLPLTMRVASLKTLPRSLVVLAREAVRGPRRLDRVVE